MTIDRVVNFSNLAEKRELLGELGKLRGLWRLTAAERKRRRTLSQNAYYHGPLLGAFLAASLENGNVMTHDDCHEWLKAKFLTVKGVAVNRQTGETSEQDYVKSTTQLSVAEMSEYIEKCIAWIGEFFGVAVPSPDDLGVAHGKDVV